MTPSNTKDFQHAIAEKDPVLAGGHCGLNICVPSTCILMPSPMGHLEVTSLGSARVTGSHRVEPIWWGWGLHKRRKRPALRRLSLGNTLEGCYPSFSLATSVEEASVT